MAKSKRSKKNRRNKSTWKMEDGLIVQQINTEVGFSNIKVYGRELTSENKNEGFNRETDEVLLYLCGHRKGYDSTKNGYMLKKEKFIELAVYMIRNYPNSIFKPINLKVKDLKAILSFLYSLDENDLLGDIENKAEMLKKWTTEFRRILDNYRDDIKIYLELYE